MPTVQSKHLRLVPIYIVSNNMKTDTFIRNLKKLNGIELLETKKLFDAVYEELVKEDCNYMLHDFVDDYTYIVHYDDGTKYMFCKGKKAYDQFMTEHGIKLERRTKELRPTYETLLVKEKKWERKNMTLNIQELTSSRSNSTCTKSMTTIYSSTSLNYRIVQPTLRS